MKGLLMAIELRRKYNQMDLLEVIKEFEEVTGQKVPQDAIEKYRFMGLNNVDFLCSNFLNSYGIYNLLQMEQVASRSEDECYKKAMELCIDVAEEMVVKKGDAIAASDAKEDEVLPAEYIFYKEGIRDLIRFCKGLPELDKTDDPFHH